MIMEKAWAKLVGSYAAIEGGSGRWTMNQMTNDPFEKIELRDENVTDTNKKGLALWEKLEDWTKKEYMIYTGTDDGSFA